MCGNLLGLAATTGAPLTGSVSRRNFLRLTGGAAALTAFETFAPLKLLDSVGAIEGEISATEPIVATVAGHTTAGLVVVDIVYTTDETGYWVLVSDGRVIAIDAPFFGDRPTLLENEYVAALAPTPTGDGYWLFTSTGRVFTYGAATPYGDLSGIALAGPVVDAVSLPSGTGYYMLASDGGVFAFGSASFHGSIPQLLPGVQLNQPVNGLVPSGPGGYWLVAGDGGLFSFGTASYVGSVPEVLPGVPLAAPVVGAIASGTAYMMVGSDGGIFNFGDSIFHGSRPATPEASGELRSPVTCVDVLADRSGYLMLDEAGTPWGFGASATPSEGAAVGGQARHTHAYLAKWDLDTMPFRWPAAEAIHYVINNDFGPPEAPDMIFAAIADVTAATGLSFVFDGFTTEYVGHRLISVDTEIPDHRDSYQPSRYGERWAPIWIGARPDFESTSTVGQAGPVAHLSLRATQQVTIDGDLFNIGEPTWVSGSVAFHWRVGGVVSLSDLPAIIRHELGHVIGLSHAGDVNQLMFPSIASLSSFANGDQLGLHLLGASTGHPSAPPPSVGTVLSNVGSVSLATESGTDSGLHPARFGRLGPCTS